MGSPLRPGSVKTNIGHLESAAGITGSDQDHPDVPAQEIRGTCTCGTSQPVVSGREFAGHSHTAADWASDHSPRPAGVSFVRVWRHQFRHVILDNCRTTALGCAAEEILPERPRHIWDDFGQGRLWSNFLPGGYADSLQGQTDRTLPSLAFTAEDRTNPFRGLRRRGLRSRCLTHGIAAGHRLGPVTRAGRAVRRGGASTPTASRFFVYGPGAQYAGDGRRLYETQPTFRRTPYRLASAWTDSWIDLSERQVQLAVGPNGLHPAGDVRNTPGHVVVQLGRGAVGGGAQCGRVRRRCFAGVYELEDGLKLYCGASGNSCNCCPAGGLMAAVFASAEQVEKLLSDSVAKVCIAARPVLKTS